MIKLKVDQNITKKFKVIRMVTSHTKCIKKAKNKERIGEKPTKNIARHQRS